MTHAEPTPQEVLWAGQFGAEYMARNRGDDLIASNTELFAKVLARTGAVDSVLELGCNIGNNLHALRTLLPQQTCTVSRSTPTPPARSSGGAGPPSKSGRSSTTRPLGRSTSPSPRASSSTSTRRDSPTCMPR